MLIYWHAYLGLKIFIKISNFLCLYICVLVMYCLEILPLPSLHIFSLLRFVIKNKEPFATNNETHKYGTWQQLDFHYSSANLKKFQTGVHYMSVKIYSSLPIYIKNELNNTKKFKFLLKKFLLENSFYWKNFTISHKDSSQFFIFIDHVLTIFTYCNCFNYFHLL